LSVTVSTRMRLHDEQLGSSFRDQASASRK
jgi:hypothetical protein